MHDSAATWPLRLTIPWQRRYLLQYLVALADTRSEIVILIDDLAEQTQMSIQTIRTHLRFCAGSGYLTYVSEKIGSGFKQLRITIKQPEVGPWRG